MKLNPSLTTQGVEERLARETDPVIRRNLELVLRHQRAEIDGDLDGIMATLIREPHYHFYGMLDAKGGVHSSEIKGYDAVRAMYQNSIATQAARRQEFKTYSVVADRYGVAYEGWLRVPMDGRTLITLGYDALPDAHYLNEGMHWTFWRFAENGLAIGENIAFDPQSFVGILERKIRLD